MSAEPSEADKGRYEGLMKAWRKRRDGSSSTEMWDMLRPELISSAGAQVGGALRQAAQPLEPVRGIHGFNTSASSRKPVVPSI